MVNCSRNNYTILSKISKILLCNFLIFLSLIGLFYISYSYTINFGTIKNTPQGTIDSFCKTLNNSEFTNAVKYIDESQDIGLLLKYNYKEIDIKTSSMYNVLQDEEDATYNILFNIKETLNSGEITTVSKQIPVRFHKIDGTWYLTNGSAKSIFENI